MTYTIKNKILSKMIKCGKRISIFHYRLYVVWVIGMLSIKHWNDLPSKEVISILYSM